MKIYDLIVIGMGPAGMAVTAMGSAMGLDVLAIEYNKIGGECMNVGCIPSKALIKASEINFSTGELELFGISSDCNIKTDVTKTLESVRNKIDKISDKKMMKAFERAEVILSQGKASFVNKNTLSVGGKEYKAKKIFIATGTEPFIPPFPGIEKLTEEQLLTNLNIFDQPVFPKSMTVIGGGAIGTEMAQAFSRLGTTVNIIQMDDFLLPNGCRDVGELLAREFKKEGIGVYNSTKVEKIEIENNRVTVYTNNGEFRSEKLLIATGRKAAISSLKLENAGIKYGKKGIITDHTLMTNVKGIYAIGDCNGRALLSHAAMHQGMLALLNAVNISPFKLNVENYFVPWSVFTKPEVAQVGMTEAQAKETVDDTLIIQKEFASYGRTIVDGEPAGFIKVITNKKGKIFGVSIIGESASEIIQEWVLAIQKKHTMFDILMLQHAFPTISMINKMVAEEWMMCIIKDKTLLKKIIKKSI